MYVAVAVGSIQGKSRFTVAEGESRNPQWQQMECWYSTRIVLKVRWDFSWFKNPQRVMPLPNQPNLFLILRVIYVFAIQKSNHPYLHISIIFIDDLTYI